MAAHVAPEWISADSVVDMTRALVATDTRNPPGQERLAADVARQLLEPLGCTFEEVEPSPGRVSLVARLGEGDPDRPVLIVNGHLDVVPINRAGWTRDPFGGEIDGGRVWGRGTADMKGGIAAAIEAVMGLRRAGRPLPCDVVFHLVADEEKGGQLGARVLSDSGMMVGDACLVPEPTSLGVCIAERGILTAEVTLSGRPAHASEPRRGVSAIEKAAKVVLALHAADFGHDAHPLLGRPSANAGIIGGGSGSNTVAERCLVTIDHRTLPGQVESDAVADLVRLIDRIDDPELRYEVSAVVFGEASELDADHPWVDLVQAAITSVRGAPAPVLGMPFATDARFVRNQAAVPAIVCGPGGLDEAHIDDEFVSIDALVDASWIYAELLAGFDEAAVTALRARPLAR
ncbi:MAG: M20 family metallopeptidase [Acidimicrobiales bacterium]